MLILVQVRDQDLGIEMVSSGAGSVGFEPPGSGSIIICTDPDPALDPAADSDLSINKQKIKCMHPRIRIRTKMSRIRHTVEQY
jgi:hypothetical protein